MTGRAIVAMSGGVDSAVAAARLVEAGYEVVGATLRLWSCEDPSAESTCCNAEAVRSARETAARLGIPHELIECSSLFDERVLRPAWEEYARGRTPNPCIPCNRDLKLAPLLLRADEIGARWVATGHHARVERAPDGSTALLRGHDRSKDQSYFLFSLTRQQLERTLFPVGDLDKADVWRIARDLDLRAADRAESQDACLAGGGEVFAEALCRRFDGVPRPGEFVSPDGEVLGRHDGIHQFTVGQRRGLGLSLGRPAYVVAIATGKNQVVVSIDPGDLMADGLRAGKACWLASPPARALVQIRYRHQAVGASLERIGDDGIEVHFDRPQRAVTPGQAAVFYDDDRVLGGAWIEGKPT